MLGVFLLLCQGCELGFMHVGHGVTKWLVHEGGSQQ